MTTGQWEAGSIIDGRYQLLAPLGEGGMGSVWRAEHLTLRSPVAVKVLNESIAENPEMLERFMREAQSAAALRSSHVVQIFDYGVVEGNPYIAMELLSGESLADRLERGPLSIAELSWVFSHISKAISKAHAEGITHRDLKPDNIFIVDDGEEKIAKVLDFGIAKVSDSQLITGNTSNTRTGTVLGTPLYMSPEQARGNRTVDWRSDLWSLGVIAFECVTRHLPFHSTALGDLVLKICTNEAPAPSSVSSVPPGFDAWFQRAVQKAPEARFQSIREMNRSLQRVLGVKPVEADTPLHLDVSTQPSAGGETDPNAERSILAERSIHAVTANPELSEFATGRTQLSTKTTGGSSVDVQLPKNNGARTALIAVGGVLLLGAISIGVLFTRGSDPQAPDPPAATTPTAAAPPTQSQLSPPSPPPPEPRVEPTSTEAAPAPSETASEQSAAPDVSPVPSRARRQKKPPPAPKPVVRRPAPAPLPKTPAPAQKTPITAPSPRPSPAPKPGLFEDRK